MRSKKSICEDGDSSSAPRISLPEDDLQYSPKECAVMNSDNLAKVLHQSNHSIQVVLNKAMRRLSHPITKEEAMKKEINNQKWIILVKDTGIAGQQTQFDMIVDELNGVKSELEKA